MLYAAADKWGINLSRSYMVGDTDTDMLAGKAAGCTTILLKRPYNKNVFDDDARVDTLTDVVRVVSSLEKTDETIRKMLENRRV